MIRAKEVEINRFGVTIRELSIGAHIPAGVIGLGLLREDKEFLSTLPISIDTHLTPDKKRSALFARTQQVIYQNPHH